MLMNTTRALQDLTKQDYSVRHSRRAFPPVPVRNEGDKPSCVEIIDVTDSADDASRPASAATDALPFPAVSLPFDVP